MQEFMFWVFITFGCANAIGYLVTDYEFRAYRGAHYAAIMFSLLALCCK